jgi:hypothetical protein
MSKDGRRCRARTGGGRSRRRRRRRDLLVLLDLALRRESPIGALAAVLARTSVRRPRRRCSGVRRSQLRRTRRRFLLATSEGRELGEGRRQGRRRRSRVKRPLRRRASARRGQSEGKGLRKRERGDRRRDGDFRGEEERDWVAGREEGDTERWGGHGRNGKGTGARRCWRRWTDWSKPQRVRLPPRHRSRETLRRFLLRNAPARSREYGSAGERSRRR